MKAVIDRDSCSGCGLCESTYPEVFKLADDGLADVIGDDDVDEAKLDECIESCPVQCITKE